MAASGRILQAYHADLQDILRATGYLPKNRSPAALGKMYPRAPLTPEVKEGEAVVINPTVHPVAASGHLTMHHVKEYQSANSTVSTYRVAATGRTRRTAITLS